MVLWYKDLKFKRNIQMFGGGWGTGHQNLDYSLYLGDTTTQLYLDVFMWGVF